MSKECNRHIDYMHGLDTYDYGARQYNPVTARWDRVDPLCEKYYNVSPYVYCVNNPVRLVDPDGRDWILCTGDKVYWYGGNLDDKSELLFTFNATSGYKDEEKNIDYQSATYQTYENKGPTPEVESFLFNMLYSYRNEGNSSIYVKVQYPNSNHKTNGGTKR